MINHPKDAVPCSLVLLLSFSCDFPAPIARMIFWRSIIPGPVRVIFRPELILAPASKTPTNRRYRHYLPQFGDGPPRDVGYSVAAKIHILA
jgi:hypothetical protein